MDMHHTMARSRGKVVVFGPHCEPQAVLQDPGKHPAGDTRSWLRVFTASLHSADAPGPLPERAAGPHMGLRSRTGPWCCRCATRCGSIEGLGIEGTGEAWRRKFLVRVGKKLTRGGHQSHLKKCSECNWSSQLSAPEIFGIGLQWEKVGLYWELNHNFHPISGSAFCGDRSNLPDVS